MPNLVILNESVDRAIYSTKMYLNKNKTKSQDLDFFKILYCVYS